MGIQWNCTETLVLTMLFTSTLPGDKKQIQSLNLLVLETYFKLQKNIYESSAPLRYDIYLKRGAYTIKYKI